MKNREIARDHSERPSIGEKSLFSRECDKRSDEEGKCDVEKRNPSESAKKEIYFTDVSRIEEPEEKDSRKQGNQIFFHEKRVIY